MIHASVCLKAVVQQSTRRARDSARDTIFRHVPLNGLVCVHRMLQWIDNFVGLIMAFSHDLKRFFDFSGFHSKTYDTIIYKKEKCHIGIRFYQFEP
jgi:hypothetical protein